MFSQDYDQRVDVVDIYLDGFNKKTISRDIALLKVYPPLSFKDGRVSPICIPKPRMTFENGTSRIEFKNNNKNNYNNKHS